MAIDRVKLSSLMDLAASGDDGAFGELASAAQDELYRLALAMGVGADDAADTAQEAFLRAYRLRGRWTPGGDPIAWLCGIALNVVRETLRRRRGMTGLIAAATLADESSQAASLWHADESAQLMRAVEELPLRQREAVACRFLRRMSIRQTAQVMGCAEGTVKSAVAAALVKLRQVLQGQP